MSNTLAKDFEVIFHQRIDENPNNTFREIQNRVQVCLSRFWMRCSDYFQQILTLASFHLFTAHLKTMMQVKANSKNHWHKLHSSLWNIS